MRKRSKIAAFFIATAAALTSSGCSTLDDGSLASAGKTVKSAMGSVLHHVVTYAYLSDPEFNRVVMPHVTNPFAFHAFMDKYRDRDRVVTEKEKIDAVIQLGILKNEPTWLTPYALKLIDKYYPTLRKQMKGGKKTKIGSATAPILLAFNDAGTMTDAAPVFFLPKKQEGLELADATADVLAAPGIFMDESPLGARVSQLAQILIRTPPMAWALLAATPPNVKNAILVGGAIILIAAEMKEICANTNSCSVEKPKTVPLIVEGNGAANEPTRGQCTPQEEAELYAGYKEICGEEESCSARYGMDENNRIYSKNKACYKAREDFAKKCMGGTYDDGHAKFMTKLRNRISKCQRLLNVQ